MANAWLLVWVVAIGGCSGGPARGPAPVGNGAATGPGDAGSAAAPIADEPPPTSVRWQALRDEYELFQRSPIGSQPCDPRVDANRLSPLCPPPAIRERAGLLLDAFAHLPPGTRQTTADRGLDDGVRPGWRAGLLGDTDEVVGEWAPITRVDKESCAIAVPASWLAHASLRRVILIEGKR